MGNHKSGTLGKLSRRVRRNQERALKARGKREKAMAMEAFKKGFNLGADMFKTKILNSTAGYEYAPEDNSDLEGCGYEQASAQSVSSASDHSPTLGQPVPPTYANGEPIVCELGSIPT
jgi:hypothetical protein